MLGQVSEALADNSARAAPAQRPRQQSVVDGPVAGEMGVSSADLALVGEAESDHAGSRLDLKADTNGDGLRDILMNGPGADNSALDAGAAYVILGDEDLSGERNLGDADAILLGESEGDHAGSGLSAAGDVDGDGLDDVLVGAPDHDEGGTDAGIAYLLSGPISGLILLNTANATFYGEEGSYRYYDDWGDLWVIPGDMAGTTVATAGDVNADGFGDLLIGTGSAGSRVYLILGPVAGEMDLGDSDAILDGGGSSLYSGDGPQGDGDMNGDGFDDILVSDIWAGAGHILLYLGGGW